MKKMLCTVLTLLIALAPCAALGESYYYPAEDCPHEGTWLIWPHPNLATYEYYKVPAAPMSKLEDNDDVWIAIAKALHTGEMVHIVAYDEYERDRIQKLLEAADVDMTKIDFFMFQSNDVWVRDTGPIFVFDENGEPVIAHFMFDGWGNKQHHDLDNALPKAVADAYGYNIIQIPEMVLEGGSIECDGAGTLLAAKSSVISPNRNPDKTQEEVEEILGKYLGITNFLWIEGEINKDITDAHIDGTARFINDHQILVCSKEEYGFLYGTDHDDKDWAIIENAKNAKGEPYELVYLPLTKDTIESYGIDLNYRVGYINFYIGNEVVIVPQYNDPNDSVALEIIGSLYPDRRIVGIDCSKLVYYGGMLHCITQQQPLSRVK